MQEWVLAAKAGEHSAWNILYQQYYPALYAQALRICGSTPAAKDAVQDAFTTAYLKLEQLNDPGSFGGWIKKILVNNCYRKQQQHRNNDRLDHLSQVKESWWDDEINRQLDHIATQNRLHATIAGLPEVLRSTLMLRYFSAYQSYEEIAVILSIPIGTVRSRMNQAKLKLAEHWRKHTDAGDDIFKESREWNHFYKSNFQGMHHHDDCRDRLMNHFVKDIEIVFTSGKLRKGREIMANEINEDRKYGSWFEPENVITSGNVSVLEAKNFNSPEYPDRCPPGAVFVIYRQKDEATRINFHLL